MLRSMYSGISGMKNFQTKLDVIGNNIANVNTTGFKKGRITFQDLMSQTSSPAQGSGDGRGGINPIQVGTGTTISSIDNVHTQGFRQNTERPLDLMIEGDGFFVLEMPDGSDAYTRAGNFYLDDNGDLVNANGYYILDSNNEKITIPPEAKSFSIQKDGTVVYIAESQGVAGDGSGGDAQPANDDEDGGEGQMEQVVAGQIQLATFPNAGGLEKAGENIWLETDSSGNPTAGTADIISGALEMSNVDLSEEFTEMITAQRGFQANTRIITTSDEILQELVNLKR